MHATEYAASPLFDVARLESAMQEAEIDALAAHSRRHFYYLSSFLSLDYVIDARSKSFIVLPRDVISSAVTTIPTWEAMSLHSTPIWVPDKVFAGQFYVKDGPSLEGPQEASTWDALVRALSSRGLGDACVAFELDQLSVATYDRLRATFPDMRIVDASPLLHRVRMLKTPEEVRRIRVACEITEEATDEAVLNMRPGMTEKTLAEAIGAGIVSRGAEVLYIQVATGQAAGLHLPTDREIKKGDIIRTDIAAVVKGYNSDLGRSYVVGPPTEEQAEIYAIAYQALQAGIEAVRPGVPGKKIFEASMAAWADAGYTHVRRHHVGHGIGLEAHEEPVLRPTTETPIEPGMVLAIEVPYYVYQLGGFAPEDILVVEDDGNTLFSHAPAELPVVG